MFDVIKECPCCGSRDCRMFIYQLFDMTNKYYISCSECGLSTSRHETKEKASEAWNKRTRRSDDRFTTYSKQY